MWINENPNPQKKLVDDCVIRALSIILDKPWEFIYDELSDLGREMYEPSISNNVWTRYLLDNGFIRKVIPDTCPDNCYAIWQFTYDHPEGEYILATGSHVVAVIDGDYYDTWDSGNEIPIYYFQRR